MAVIAAVAVTLLLSLSLSTVFLFRAWSESEANWQLARQSVDDMIPKSPRNGCKINRTCRKCRRNFC